MTEPDYVTIKRGTDVAIEVDVSETTHEVTIDYDLTGATLTARICGTPGWTVTPVITDAANGICEIRIPKATTANIPPGYYETEVEVVKDGITRIAVEFTLRVESRVAVS